MSRARNAWPTASSVARTVVPLAVALLVVSGCGGKVTPPNPDGARQVSGRVVLPAGAAVTLGSLRAVTGLGSFGVAADGSFEAQVIGDAPTEIAVLDQAGALVAAAVAGEAPVGTTVEVDSRSSAAVLLYYALGGFLLPADAQDELWDLIQRDEAVEDIASVVSAALAGGGLPLADDNAAVADALALAWQSVMGPRAMALAQSGAGGREAAAPGLAGLLEPQASGAGNIVIEPGAGTLQSGVAVIHNPLGSGVAAQNTFRRPGALLAYQVGYQDEGGADQELSPPVLAGTVDVPSTEALGVFQALTDVVTGESPWSPVVSEGLPLPLYQGRRTYYELVLLGPSLDVVTRPPLYDDPRFSAERSRWNEVIGDKAVEQFLNDVALPALETFALGSVGHIDAKKLTEFRRRFKAINDQHLASLGVFLKAGGGYAEAVGFLLAELGSGGGGYRLDFMEAMRDALIESERNRLDFEAVETRLRSRAAASGIAAAVQLALSAGDIGAILKDLNDSLPAVGWTATASPTLFALTPELAYFTKHQPQVELRVATRGPVTGTFMYRWSTSGTYGQLTDGPQRGTTIDTAYPNVWYTHGSPLTISDDQRDGVWVEVFDVEQGATGIPAGQEPIARLAAELRGFNREIDSRLEVQYGSTAPGYFKDGITVGCATMYLRIPKQAGVKRYAVAFQGWGGVGNENNYNTYLYHNSSYTWYIDPANPDGHIWPFTSVCDWFGPDGVAYSAPYSFHTYDAGNDYLVAVFTTMDFVGETPAGALLTPDYVRLWYDWASRGTVTVTVSK